MRTLLKLSFIWIAGVFAFQFCAKENNMMLDGEQKLALKTRSNITAPIKHISGKRVTRDYIPTILDGFFEKKEFAGRSKYSIDSVTKDGRTLMYIINFDKEGWVILSGRLQEETLILGHSTSGSFNPDKNNGPEVEFWMEKTSHSIEKQLIEDELFSDLNNGNHCNNNDFSVRTSLSLMEEDTHFWALLPNGTHYTTDINSTVTPLLSTKWGQNYPWNYLCPYINGSQCATGCGAVAFAQILYYLHYEIGKPTHLFHQIDTCYQWQDSYYLSHHNMSNKINSTRWDYMPLTNPNIQTTGTNYVGDLMIELGHFLETRYSDNVSLSQVNPDVFGIYGISHSSLVPFNYSTAKSQLDNALPLFVSGYHNNNNAHGWVIDGYVSYRTIRDDQSIWHRLPIESLSDYGDYPCFSERDMALLNPNVQDGDIDHYYYTPTYRYEFYMNWGRDGVNDGLYAMTHCYYPYYQNMIYGFQ